EILSKGNEKYDLIDKKKIYEQSDVKEYWVVDPDTKLCSGFVLTDKIFQPLEETQCSFVIRMFNLTIQI
ncbi:MAG TPA: Uma2 family endonuclease, partial [Chitinophagaceae bacterium]|nr:Uma2 family endonuclease [Chitinophagaceae bacterium]